MNDKLFHEINKFNFPFIVTGSYVLFVDGQTKQWDDIDLIVPYVHKEEHINNFLIALLKTNEETVWYDSDSYPYDVDVKNWYLGDVKIHIHHTNTASFEALSKKMNGKMFMPSDMVIEYQKASIPLDKLARIKYEKNYFSQENQHELLQLEHSVCFKFEGVEYGLCPVLKLGGFDIWACKETDRYVGCYDWAKWFLGVVTERYKGGDVVPYIKNIVKI